MPRVLLYSTAWCPYCARARALLRARGANFEELDIEARPERRAEMVARSGRTTVPQIFIGERHIGGCDELQALDAAGDLEPLLRSS
ncbi:MAG: glutaredoxin 3 [Gammaproteobacteria bacterium]|nr:glutaredoxin 3 [Gammaproteobacteria bacterium]